MYKKRCRAAKTIPCLRFSPSVGCKLHHNQYGFRKKRGTEAATFRIYESIAIAQNHQHQCNIVCRDVSKAFDKVLHNGLRFKILQLGLPDIMERLLCNFISNRKVQIRYNNKLDNGFDICSGVPQGSVLSLLLQVYCRYSIQQISPLNVLDAKTLFSQMISPSSSYIPTNQEN